MGAKKFSPGRSFNRTNIKKVPAGKPIVYELMNEKGTNIYTGSAMRGRGPERLGDHLPTGKDPIPGTKTFRVKQKPLIAEAEKEEKQIIKKEKPKYNK